MSLDAIVKRLEAAERSANRDIGSTELIAVSKVQPNERVEAVLQEGHRIFGENRVKEAYDKWPQFKESYEGVKLHLIGPLQTNKARQAMQLFDVIHSLDRLKLAKTLARVAQDMGTCPDLFLQVNTGREPQKSGIMPEETEGFLSECASMDLSIKGLMCIPPAHEAAETHFKLMAELTREFALPQLSMGMSGDFETAVQHGATHVRVGSAIFGARVYAAKQ